MQCHHSDRRRRRGATLQVLIVAVLAAAVCSPVHATTITGVSDTGAVVRVAKTFSFTGTGITAGDTAFWTDRTDCDTITKNEGGELELASDLTVTATFMEVTPPSEPLVLCYSFGGAPYTRYAAQTLIVRGVTALDADIGNPYVYVLDVHKTMVFQGTGMADGDSAQWVQYPGPDETPDCSGSAVNAPITGTGAASGVVTVLEAGNSLAFTTPMLAHTSGELALCYKFQAESDYAYFDDIRLVVGSISGWLAGGRGDDDVGVVGQAKDFAVNGTAVTAGDRVKWAPASAQNDAHCTGNYDGGDALVEGGASGVPVSSIHPSTGTLVVKPLTTSPKLMDWKLCYRHRSEPWRLYGGLRLRSKGIFSATQATSIVGTANVIRFSGLHFRTTDGAMWVPRDATCDSVSDTEPGAAAGGSSAVTPDFNYDIPSYNRHFADDQHSVGTFTFTKPGVLWVLCYRFDVERYQAVVGILKTYTMYGTVGITSGDAIKWIENTASDCDTAAAQGFAEGVTELPVRGASNTAASDTSEDVASLAATSGRGTADLQFVSPSPDFRPWRLCYRFGSSGSWILFPSVTMAVHQVTSVHLILSESGSHLLVDIPQTIVFRGSGINDGDMAKWVVWSDEDGQCSNALAGGSTEQPVVQGQATYLFTSEVEQGGLVLCYKFGSEPYQAYPEVPVVLESQLLPAPRFVFGRVKGGLTMTYPTLQAFPSGSEAANTLQSQAATDLAMALRVDERRVEVTGLEAGSVIINFELRGSANSADATVLQLRLALEEMIADTSSRLYTGIVTRDIDTEATLAAIAAGAWVFEEAQDIDSVDYDLIVSETSKKLQDDTIAGDVVDLSVREFQSAGLFQFASAEYRATEGSVVTLTVTRLHGSSGSVVLQCTVADETATHGTLAAGGDYQHEGSSELMFADKQTSATTQIVLHEDGEQESHFETFHVSISFYGGEQYAELGTIPTAVVRVYDWGAPGNTSVLLYASSWALADGAHSLDVLSSEAMQGAEEPAQQLSSFFRGWKMSGNGGDMDLLVDVNGLYGVDKAYDSSDYNSRCDYAAPLHPCVHSCPFGFPYHATLGMGTGVAALSGSGYVATLPDDPITDWPTVELSITMWVKANAQYASNGAALLTYAVHKAEHGDAGSIAGDFMETMLSDAKDLRFMLHGRVVNVRRGLKTGVNIADGNWHHLAVTWRSSDGQVHVHKDGAVAFVTQGYRTGLVLESGGALVVGQQQRRTGCGPDSPQGGCSWAGQVVPGKGFVGNVQNLRVWEYVLTPPEVGHGMVWPFERSHVGLILYWRFEDALVTRVEGGPPGSYAGASLLDMGTGGLAHTGRFSSTGVSIEAGTPSTHPNFPCGAVHTNVWYFQLPDSVLGQHPLAYDGRLQFALMSPTQAGTLRTARGSVVLEGGPIDAPISLSYSLSGFDTPVANDWSRYSVILREDHGWIKEPSLVTPTAQEMLAVLRELRGVFVRGDWWLYSEAGSGQEVTYINDVAWYSGY